jgi:hypothetical protein
MRDLCVVEIMIGSIHEVPMYVSYFAYVSPVQDIYCNNTNSGFYYHN